VAKSTVNLSAVDLNLLVVFDALMQERNVTRAAGRLALSQPAVSHALARLRHMLRDELFVRSPRGMLPTPRAEQLAGPVRHAVEELQRALEEEEFDPAKATRTFRVAVDNYSAIVLTAPLAARVAMLAPHITLEFQPSGTLDLADLFDRGLLDVALGFFMQPAERFGHRKLLGDGLVVLMRKDHPAASGRKLTAEKFASLPHLDVSSSRYTMAFVENALKRNKLARRIAVRAPLLSAGSMLASSDSIAVLPGRIAQVLMRFYPLASRDLPFVSPAIETEMLWPRWLDGVPAHRWLRQVVEPTAQAEDH
jgi:DNA-binding transcriptional LysR family regulator